MKIPVQLCEWVFQKLMTVACLKVNSLAGVHMFIICFVNCLRHGQLCEPENKTRLNNLSFRERGWEIGCNTWLKENAYVSGNLHHKQFWILMVKWVYNNYVKDTKQRDTKLEMVHSILQVPSCFSLINNYGNFRWDYYLINSFLWIFEGVSLRRGGGGGGGQCFVKTWN